VSRIVLATRAGRQGIKTRGRDFIGCTRPIDDGVGPRENYPAREDFLQKVAKDAKVGTGTLISTNSR
jgi:hypothetical protein